MVTGIVVCTHSNYAAGIKDAVEMIAGPQENFDVIGFMPGEEMMELSEKLKELAGQYESRKEKYIFLVDMFGATPFNAAAAALAEYDTTVITGVNMPVLMELVFSRETEEDYDSLVQTAVTQAREGIKAVGMREMFGQKD